ncbi:fatty acid desaturase [Psychrobium sp. 1_MG-2023]|uniref:acyl-CoA desaturase n=1 Tax=Psychrobium sp. 1_MG-2023 TaxID=3062624 RepID=UPI000C33D60F|nr:fatty acid desaturase [Psychrobium sp. 1_MG-2023]MDP2562274.1 fatty acid desaturase [Psychrobium sp. 1_MG-2023]PKF54658.1 acyl-CoA desaturase [Alteromonadales bacterium alter-6D02]
MNKPPIIWTNVILFSSTLLAALILVPWYQVTYGFDAFVIIAAVASLFFCGLSITAGYHRLWSHRTYQAHWSVRLFFAIGGAFALQNSALHWSSDHRVHHKFVDINDKDPYSAKRGFWFSHIGWMLRHYNHEQYDDYSNCRDLQRDPIVMWQHKHYLALTLITNIGFALLVGWLSGQMLASFIAVGITRLVLSHHFTFFINSWAHMWGSQPYTDKNTAKDNALLAVFTHGEGYHNFHHIFESDYRNGIKWYHYDPTKWLIKTLSWLGLATNLRKTPQQKIEQAQLAMILKRSTQRLDLRHDAEEMKQKLHAEYEILVTKLNEFYTLKKRLFEVKKRKALKDYDKLQLVKQLKELQQSFEQQRQAWLMLANHT